MSLMALDVTEQSFEEEVLKSETPVIVDFWAEWCGPCHAVAPVLEKIAEERSGEVKLVKVNIDEEQGLSQRCRFRSRLPPPPPLAEGPACRPFGALRAHTPVRGVVSDQRRYGSARVAATRTGLGDRALAHRPLLRPSG